MPISSNCKIHKSVVIQHRDLVNLYGCSIGKESKIGAFVEIQKNVKIGEKCKISTHSFLCEGVEIKDRVFIGHGVMFINDKFPQATNNKGFLKEKQDWILLETLINDGVSIGSNATIMGGVTIGENALIGAGALVTKNVPPFSTAVGVPARIIDKSKSQ